jgi:hypothetical protein
MRLRRTVSASALVLAMLGSTLVVGASPAAAVPHGTSVSIVSSKCVGRDGNGKPTIGWIGSGFESTKSTYLKTRVMGKLFTCFWKFKFSDKDKKFDYWGASVQSYWIRTDKYGNPTYPALASHQIASSKTAKDGVFDGTNTYTSKKSCTTQVDVGVSAGAFSVSTPIQACSSYKMQAVRTSNSAGYWKMPKVGGFTRVETAYMQKVAQGAKPTFSMSVNYPYYGCHYSEGLGHWVATVTLKTVFVKL